ncbi:MAG: hypothetical protein LBV33_06395 [Lachnospiraceae bacterium]|jgi:hypothetical protein|nr:hypothetical protein [Lachnospiraceae bacterium]
MKTGRAVFVSILIAIIIIMTGVIVYIVVLEIQERQAEAAEHDVLMATPLSSKPLYDEDGAAAGAWAYVEVSDRALANITAGELKDFAEEYLFDERFEWISILSPSGEGVYFPDINTEYAEYGTLTSDGRMETLKKVIELEDDHFVFRDVEEGMSSASTGSEGEGGSDEGTEAVLLDEAVVPDDGEAVSGISNEIIYESGDATAFSVDINQADYINEQFGIQFTAPEGFQMLGEDALSASEDVLVEFLPADAEYFEEASEGRAESEFGMYCSSSFGLPSVAVGIDDLTTTDISYDQYMEEMLSTIENDPDEVWTRTGTQSVEIAGQQFEKVSFNTSVEIPELGSIDGTQDMYFAQNEGKVLCIVLANLADEELQAYGDALINAFLPLQN